MADDFVKFKFDWLEAIATDAEVSDAECRVALIVSTYINRQTREAWMSVETVARRAHYSHRTTQRALSALVSHGFLDRQAQSGRGHTNIYRPQLPTPEKVTTVTPFEPEKVTDVTPFDEAERVTTVSPLPPERVTNATVKGDKSVTQNTLKNNLKEMNPLNGAREKDDWRAKGEEEGFAKFWSVYPRQEGRDLAQRAFNSAVRSGVSPAILIAGAQRYAAAQRGQEQRYIAMPSNWLRNRRWLDVTSGGPVIDQAGNVVDTPVTASRQAPRRASHEDQAMAIFKVRRDE